jgi:kelch-like protein 18
VGLSGRFYVVGGYNGSDRVTTVEMYDPVTNRWRRLSGMQVARWSLAAGAINGKLYAVGGHGEDGAAPHEVYIP